MRLYGFLLAVLLVAQVPSTGQAFTLFVGDQNCDPVVPCVPIDVDADQGTGFPTATFHLCFDSGTEPTVPSNLACAGGGATNWDTATDTCMFDVNLQSGPGIRFEVVTETMLGIIRTADVDLNVKNELRFNAGDPTLGMVGPKTEIMALEMSASALDTVMVQGEMWVDTNLNGNIIPTSEIFHSGPDLDQDGLCDERDPCVDFVNVDLTDADGDGIPNECQCGDATGNGVIQSTDIPGMNACASNSALCDATLVDSDGNGLTQSQDIVQLNNVANGAPAYTLKCLRRLSGVAPPPL